jgi:nucleotide-binding universal stress UspA family protein
MLSSHGQGGLSSWNISSVAQKIIDRAMRSFMLVPAYRYLKESVKEIQYRRIVVPLDGSRRAEFVLPIACRLAAEHGAELVLVHAISPPVVIQRHTLTPEEETAVEKITERNRVKAERYLEQMAAQSGSGAVTRLISGSNTVDSLLEFVQNNEVDLVVMSAHGSSGETVRPHGSVVTSFIAYSSIPLLLIQDLSQDQIRPTQAELKTIDNGSIIGRMNRTIAYGYPATWSRR